MYIRNHMTQYKLSIVALLVGATMLLLSCSEKTKIEKFDPTKIIERPQMSADSLIVLRSDSARLILRFTAPVAIMDEDENGLDYTECPNGFLIERFDKEGAITSRISAEYGKRFNKEERYEALGNVIVTTEKGDTLKTEQLIFLHKKDRLYSEKYVRIYQTDRIIHGVGFESDSDLKNRIFYKTHGNIYVDNQTSTRRKTRRDSIRQDSISLANDSINSKTIE